MSMTRRQFLQQTVTSGVAATWSAGLLFNNKWVTADDGDAIPVPEPRIAQFERMAYGMFIHDGS